MFTTCIGLLHEEFFALYKFTSKKKILSLVNQNLTFTNYKNHTTVKFLIGISPAIVILMSHDWDGKTSDRQIVIDSGILNFF